MQTIRMVKYWKMLCLTPVVNYCRILLEKYANNG